MKKYTVILLFIFLAAGLCAQEFDRVKMDSLFSLIDAGQKGMGSISIFSMGEEVYQRSIGYSDVENGLLADASTKYRIGSISKPFTSVIIMQFVDEGKLALDSKLYSFYPGVPNAREITIEQLLRHESGIFNFTNSRKYTSYMEQPKTRAELLKIIVDGGTIFKPGERMEYSNSNYVLLSMIIEQVEMKDFSKVLNERIIKPLKLKNTYYGSKIVSSKNEAFSYNGGDTWELSTETDMSIPLGAGAIVSTPTDLNIFFFALFNGKLVSQESLDKMTEFSDNVGLGLFLLPFYEKRAVGHQGGIDAFQSTAGFFREDDVSIAYTTNGVVMPKNNIMIGALSVFFGLDYSLPKLAASVKVDVEDLDIYLGVYAAPDFPLKVSISKNESGLIGQATGQSAFPLEAYEKDKFRFEQAALTMQFLPGESKMILRQGGQEFELTLED